MNSLFSMFKIKDMALKNRIVMAPMCMYMAEDGIVNDWHKIHYTTRAIGGTGLIMIEATAVDKCGCITEGDLGIWSDEHIEGLKSLVDLVHMYGGKIGIQLAHAGRKSMVKSERILAPSMIAFSRDYRTPERMTISDIEETIKAFQEGAIRALKAGFDVVEIHGAHGYLINQFLSPLTNIRTDDYGRTPENRVRFLKEIIMDIRRVWPMEKPLFLRVSAEEYDEEGLTPDDVASLINMIKNRGVDMIDVSSGGVVTANIPTYPGYQLKMAETIKEKTGLPVIAGGLVTEVNLASEVIANGRGELIYFGRELLRNPYWPLYASKALGLDIDWPEPYEKSKL